MKGESCCRPNKMFSTFSVRTNCLSKLLQATVQQTFLRHAELELLEFFYNLSTVFC